MAEKEGTQIILVNPHREVLLYLQDDKPDILYPRMWSLLGGMLEPDETPAECIVREIEEEIGVQLDPATVTHLCTRDLDFGIEHSYTAPVDCSLRRHHVRRLGLRRLATTVRPFGPAPGISTGGGELRYCLGPQPRRPSRKPADSAHLQ